MGQIQTQADTVYRDKESPGSSVVHEPVKSEIRALFGTVEDRVDAAIEGASGAFIIKDTEAALNADLAHVAGTYARVIADTQSPPENGYYVKSGGSGSGSWTFVAQDPAVVAADEAEASAALVFSALEALPGTFVASVDDEYMRRLVTGVKIEGGDLGHEYILNYETIYFAGLPLWRIRFKLFDTTLGLEVATWSRQSDTAAPSDSYTPETISVSQVVNGSAQPGYMGITATVWIDWTQIEYTHNLTTYTLYGDAGIDTINIVSNEQMDDFLIAPRPAVRLTVGAGTETATHFNTIAAAVESLYIPGETITRSTFPCSDLCSYSRQVLVEVIDDAYSEEIIPTSPGGIDQSLLVPHFAIIKLRADSVVFVDDAVIDSAPVFETPFSCWIEGGIIDQRQEGYNLHADSLNTVTQRAVAGPDVLRMKWRQVFKTTLRNSGATTTACMIGQGVSNGSTTDVSETVFERVGAGIAPHHLAHTSPAATDPGRIIWRDNISNDGDTGGACGLDLVSTHESDVRNIVIVSNSEIERVKADAAVWGTAWVRRGTIIAGTAVPANLDP